MLLIGIATTIIALALSCRLGLGVWRHLGPAPAKRRQRRMRDFSVMSIWDDGSLTIDNVAATGPQAAVLAACLAHAQDPAEPEAPELAFVGISGRIPPTSLMPSRN